MFSPFRFLRRPHTHHPNRMALVRGLHDARLAAQGRLIHVVRRAAGLLYRPSNRTDFVVVCAARTGSTYLGSLLHSHPNIRMYGEAFLPQRLCLDRWILRNPVQYLRHDIYGGYPHRVRSVGFKLIYNQARGEMDGPIDPHLAHLSARQRRRLEAVWRYLERRVDLKVIHLRRRNVIRSAISVGIARKTSEWARQRGETPVSREKRMSFAPDALLRQLESVRRGDATCTRVFRNHPVLDVYYEDLVSDRERELGRIQDFVGVPRAKLRSTLVRQNPEPLSVIISNYAELQERLRGTPWEDQLKG